MTSLRHKEKFRRALFYLAVQEGDVRSRLRNAYNEIRVLLEDEVPTAFRQEWKDIQSDLTRRDPLVDLHGNLLKSSLDHTLSRMQNRTARKIAERIYRIAIELQ